MFSKLPATFDAPAWLHHALETRALATISGRCPRGATHDFAEVRAGEYATAAMTPAMEHEPGCLVDPRLGSAAVLPEWFELHAIATVDLPDEAREGAGAEGVLAGPRPPVHDGPAAGRRRPGSRSRSPSVVIAEVQAEWEAK